jgi:hypothetical protein
VPISGQSTDQNQCASTIDPPLAPPGTATVPVTFSATAHSQPHQGNPIQLTNTTVAVTIAADTIQQGVTLGFISNGTPVPSTLTTVVNGQGTTEGTHTYTVTSTPKVVVVNGQAQPLKATLDLPDTTWHPKNATDPVIFAEKSLTVVAKIDLTASLGFVVTATFTCQPSSAPPFIVLGAQGPPPTVTTTTLSPITTTTTPGPTVGGSTDPSTTAVAAATTSGTHSGTTSGTLPRTGLNALLFLIIAAVLLDAGIAMIAFTRRRQLGDS